MDFIEAKNEEGRKGYYLTLLLLISIVLMTHNYRQFTMTLNYVQITLSHCFKQYCLY